MTLILTFAFGAGLVSPLNPCGFGLLPAFLGYQLGGEQQRREAPLAVRLGQGLVTGGAVSAGFVGVLVSAALIVALGLRPLLGFVPFAAVVIGVVLVAAGVAVLAGRRVSVDRLGQLGALRPGSVDDSPKLVAFGAGYAVASVACTIAVLLAVVGQALATGSFPRMLAVLFAYGAGAATLLTTLAVSTAVAGSVMSTWLRRAMPFMEPLAGALLILSGTYLVATNVRGLRDLAAVRTVNVWFTDTAAQASGLAQSVYAWFAVVTLALLLMAVWLLIRQRLARARLGPGPGSPGAVGSTAHAPRTACCEQAETQAPLAAPSRVGDEP